MALSDTLMDAADEIEAAEKRYDYAKDYKDEITDLKFRLRALANVVGAPPDVYEIVEAAYSGWLSPKRPIDFDRALAKLDEIERQPGVKPEWCEEMRRAIIRHGEEAGMSDRPLPPFNVTGIVIPIGDGKDKTRS
jgi:hypothetical protein